MLNQKVKIWRFLFWQLVVIAVFCYLAIIISGKVATKACVMAGLVVMLPQIVFVFLMFKHAGARASRQVVNAFYLGEALKLLLTGGLFWFALAKMQLNLNWFFMTFLVGYSAYVWVPLWLEKDI